MEDQLQYTYDQNEEKRNPAQLKVSAQGRVVIPVEMRRELGIDPGEVMVARVEGDKLVLEKKSAVLARLRKRFAHIPRDVSLADELIAERREEVRRGRSREREGSGS